METNTLKIVRGLLIYSLSGANWEFKNLTSTEKNIVGCQENLDTLRLLYGDKYEEKE